MSALGNSVGSLWTAFPALSDQHRVQVVQAVALYDGDVVKRVVQRFVDGKGVFASLGPDLLVASLKEAFEKEKEAKSRQQQLNEVKEKLKNAETQRDNALANGFDDPAFKYWKDEVDQLSKMELALINASKRTESAERAAKRLKLSVEEGTLPQRRPAVSLNTWLNVEDFPPLRPSSIEQPPKLIYVRQAVVEVFDLIRSPARSRCWLRGPPGTGKSQLSRLVAVACALDGVETTFGEVRNSEYYITVLSGGKWTRTQFSRDDFVIELKTAYKQPGGFVVLDGVVDRKEDDPVKSLANDMLLYHQGSRTLVISSGQLSLKDVAADLAMPGWTLEELRNAVADQDFLDTTALKKEVDDGVDVSSVVERKHCLCGGSARLVFGCDSEMARDILMEALQELDATEKKGVLFGQIRSRHSRAKNVLMQSFLGPSRSYKPLEMRMAFSSKFVLRQLEEAIDLDDMLSLYKHCCSINPTMQGWAFEELVFKYLSRQEPATYSIREDGQKHAYNKAWAVDCVASFTRSNPGKNELEGLKLLTADGKSTMSLHLQRCVLLRPLSEWNFPTLDHILLLRDRTKWTLIALQDSIAKKHKFNDHVLISLHSALKGFMPSRHKLDDEIQLIAVVPQGQFSQFQFGAGVAVRGATVSISRLIAFFHDLPE